MMIILKYIRCISVLLILTAFVSCDSDYTRLVKAENEKGIRQDSLLLGIKFRNTRNEFYARCFGLNKRKVVTQGVGFSVRYSFVDSLTHDEPTPIELLFFPLFDTLQNINAMNMEFMYTNWAPENANVQSDTLRSHVTKILRNWYGGNDFVSVELDGEQIPVKVDGNRRILVFKEDTRRVLVRVHDLSHPIFAHKGVKFLMKDNEEPKNN